MEEAGSRVFHTCARADMNGVTDRRKAFLKKALFFLYALVVVFSLGAASGDPGKSLASFKVNAFIPGTIVDDSAEVHFFNALGRSDSPLTEISGPEGPVTMFSMAEGDFVSVDRYQNDFLTAKGINAATFRMSGRTSTRQIYRITWDHLVPSSISNGNVSLERRNMPMLVNLDGYRDLASLMAEPDDDRRASHLIDYMWTYDFDNAKYYFTANSEDHYDGFEISQYDASSVNVPADVDTGTGGIGPRDLIIAVRKTGESMAGAADWNFNGSFVMKFLPFGSGAHAAGNGTDITSVPSMSQEELRQKAPGPFYGVIEVRFCLTEM